MKRKWFSFDPKTGKIEEIKTVSPDLFNSDSDLLFWTRGLEEWVKGSTALGYFKANPEPSQS